MTLRRAQREPSRTWPTGRLLMRTGLLVAMCTLSASAASFEAPRAGSSGLDWRRRLVTSGNAPSGGGHLAPGGTTVQLPGMDAPLNPDGVVSLVDASAGVFCSGALIGDHHVLTSAHCVEPTSIYSPDHVSFDTASDLTSVPIADIFIHPSYEGPLETGYDIAVLQLVSGAPVDAPRYGIYEARNELGRVTVKAGHGRTGHGSVGINAFDAHRRVGLNTYDATSTDLNRAFGMAITAEAYLAYDFDSGQPDNNAWNQHGVSSDLGFGADEANAVAGDSGGPTFIHDGTGWTIAGVTAWGAGLATNPPDVTPGITDGSWGEISADTRVSSYAPFVRAVVDGTFVRPQRYAYSHGNVDPGVSWQRPPTDANAPPSERRVPYHSYAYTVDTTGQYDLESTQTFDGVIYLYEGMPDPAHPLVGLIAGNDDGPDGPRSSTLADTTLNAGVTYTLITSASTIGEVGTFLNTITGPGRAEAIASSGGFSGDFAPTLWRFETDHADARVQLDTAPGGVTIFGGNDSSAGNTRYTTLITQDQVTLSFDWTYFNLDDTGFDLFGVQVDGELTRLTDGADLYGSHSVTLGAGDEFGFVVHTVDGVKGEGIVNVYNFAMSLAGDLNRDGLLDAADIAILFANWGVVPPSNSVADMNHDGLVNALDRDAWVHDLRGISYGDADMNGTFDSADLVRVASAGEYEDAIVGNSEWATGDWTGDGDFTSSDLILALSDGGYAQAAAVPEPSSAVFLLLTVVILGLVQRRTNRSLAKPSTASFRQANLQKVRTGQQTARMSEYVFVGSGPSVKMAAIIGNSWRSSDGVQTS